MTSGRWRCKGCGSTRVTAIAAAYVCGRMTPDGRSVEEGSGARWEQHEGTVDPGSVHCENCGGGEARFERSVRRAALTAADAVRALRPAREAADREGPGGVEERPAR